MYPSELYNTPFAAVTYFIRNRKWPRACWVVEEVFVGGIVPERTFPLVETENIYKSILSKFYQVKIQINTYLFIYLYTCVLYIPLWIYIYLSLYHFMYIHLDLFTPKCKAQIYTSYFFISNLYPVMKINFLFFFFFRYKSEVF